MEILHCAYDLARCPPTYDFVSALLGFEMKRREHQAKSLSVHVLPGPEAGFRRDNLPPFGAEAREAMLRGIVLPMGIFLADCTIERHAKRIAPMAPSGIGRSSASYGFHLKVEAAR